MDRIFEHSLDLHVRNTYVYSDLQDGYAYEDGGCTTKFGAHDLINVFVKGAIVNESGTLYTPIGLVTAADGLALAYIKPSEGNATIGTITYLYPKEFGFDPEAPEIPE